MPQVAKSFPGVVLIAVVSWLNTLGVTVAFAQETAASLDAAPDPGAAEAEAARADALAAGERTLRAYLEGTRTLRADFEQSLLGANGELLQTSSGELMIRRPGRFRWDYLQPYEQRIVADGQRLWLYDPDLEQVTVRPQQATLENTPASLLSGDSDFTRDYRLTHAMATDEGEQALRLEPRVAGGDFSYLALGFDAAGELKRMELLDRLDQLTRIEFTNVRRDVRLRRGLFNFRPPEGVDVIETDMPIDTAPSDGSR
jgi:outer membrane lipoprotein carrier protein